MNLPEIVRPSCRAAAKFICFATTVRSSLGGGGLQELKSVLDGSVADVRKSFIDAGVHRDHLMPGQQENLETKHWATSSIPGETVEERLLSERFGMWCLYPFDQDNSSQSWAHWLRSWVAARRHREGAPGGRAMARSAARARAAVAGQFARGLPDVRGGRKPKR